jgi:hypothetical protein
VLLLEALEGERPLLVRCDVNEFDAAKPAHAEGSKDLEVVQAEVLELCKE